MRFRLKLIIVFLSFASVCSAQEQNNWDESLDRYELICQRCAELKRQEQQGIKVSQESLSSLLVQLTMLSNSLSAIQGSMSAAQKARFEMIRRRIGKPAPTRKHAKSISTKKEVPSKQKTVSEEIRPERVYEMLPLLDAEFIKAAGIEQIPENLDLQATFNDSYQKEKEQSVEQLDVNPARKTSFLIAVQSGLVPDLTGGMMLGFGFSHVGVYLSGRSNFTKARPADYFCDSSGNIFDEEGATAGIIWTEGRKSVSRGVISAGVYAFPSSILSPYIGAGYGFRTYSLSDTDGHWAQVTDLSTKGMNLDAGLLLRLGHFVAGAGANLTFPFAQQSPKYLELTVSLGVSF